MRLLPTQIEKQNPNENPYTERFHIYLIFIPNKKETSKQRIVDLSFAICTTRIILFHVKTSVEFTCSAFIYTVFLISWDYLSMIHLYERKILSEDKTILHFVISPENILYPYHFTFYYLLLYWQNAHGVLSTLLFVAWFNPKYNVIYLLCIE